MEYKFVRTDHNYERYSAWRVLYSAPWSAPFPVRLIDELFLRACELLGRKDNLKLYDPCVWSGYMMTIIWLLHWKMVERIDGSDIDEKMLKVADKNLSLLSSDWMQKRIVELGSYIKLYAKQSHVDAFRDAQVLLDEVVSIGHTIQTKCRIQDMKHLDNIATYDLVITDLPYGNRTFLQWDIDLQVSIEGLWSLLCDWWVLVLISDKKQHFRNFPWQTSRKELSHGKRRITFLKKV